MFRTSDLVVIKKIDLPRLDFDIERHSRNLDAVHPGVPRMLVSATMTKSVEAWSDW